MGIILDTPEIITIVTVLLWITGISAGIGKILFWTILVSSHRYRIDLFLEFLNTRRGLRLLAHPVGVSDAVLASILIVVSLQYGPNSIVWLEFSILSIALYLWHTIWYFSTYPLSGLPRWELKTLLLLFGSIIASLITMSLPTFFIDIHSLAQIALFQICIPIYGWLLLILFHPFLQMHDRSRVERARKRIDAFAPVVIAVAGAYGKSSTVAYLQHILQDSFSVITTLGHGASDQEVTRMILEDLTPEHQVCIVELQATGRGDIAQTCTIAPPIMTIVTELPSESQDTPFHSPVARELVTEAITALPSNGLAILNRDDAHALELARSHPVKTKFFSLQDIAHVYATDIFIARDTVSFMLHIGNEKKAVRAPLFGKHVVYSIVAAATAASHLGVSIDTIVKNIETALASPSRSLRAEYGVNHALIIDNTTARSTAELLAGSDYASIYTDKHIVVVVDAATLQNESAIARIAAIADFCLLTHANKRSAEYIQKFATYGISADALFFAKNEASAIQLLRQSITPDDVILLDGPVSQKIQDAVFSR